MSKARFKIKQVLSTYTGIVPYYKDRGQWCTQVADWFRRMVEAESGLVARKIGLNFQCLFPVEPFGEGVVLVGIGGHCRHLRMQKYLPMKYELIGELGRSTSSYSFLGQTLTRKSYESITCTQMESVCESMLGNIQLSTPPMIVYPNRKTVDSNSEYNHNDSPHNEDADRRFEFEIIKRNRFRQEELKKQREPRLCDIHAIQLLDFRPPYFRLSLECSGSCYVRSLIHELGLRLHCEAITLDVVRRSIDTFERDQCLQKSDIYWEYIEPLAKRSTDAFVRTIKPYKELEPISLNYQIL